MTFNIIRIAFIDLINLLYILFIQYTGFKIRDSKYYNKKVFEKLNKKVICKFLF